jgi:hypothetical protein
MEHALGLPPDSDLARQDPRMTLRSDGRMTMRSDAPGSIGQEMARRRPMLSVRAPAPHPVLELPSVNSGPLADMHAADVSVDEMDVKQLQKQVAAARAGPADRALQPPPTPPAPATTDRHRLLIPDVPSPRGSSPSGPADAVPPLRRRRVAFCCPHARAPLACRRTMTSTAAPRSRARPAFRAAPLHARPAPAWSRSRA